MEPGGRNIVPDGQECGRVGGAGGRPHVEVEVRRGVEHSRREHHHQEAVLEGACIDR